MTTALDVIREKNRLMYQELGKRMVKSNKVRGINLPAITKTFNDEQNYKLAKILNMSLPEMVMLFIKNIDNIQLGKDTLFCTKDKKLCAPNHSCPDFVIVNGRIEPISRHMICLNCSYEKSNALAMKKKPINSTNTI